MLFNHKPKLDKNTTVRLTQEGREKVGASFNGDPKCRILVALEANGTSDMEEIANYSRLSIGNVEANLRGLISLGYVQPVGIGTSYGSNNSNDDMSE